MIDLYNMEVKEAIHKLDNVIRAEHIKDSNYLSIYAGLETINEIYNIKNQVIYGRRGAGKTHLLKAFQERLISSFNTEKKFPVYIDLRKLLPLISNSENNYVEFATISFKYIIEEILETVIENIDFIFGVNELDKKHKPFTQQKINSIDKILRSFNYNLSGEGYVKIGDFEIVEGNVKEKSLDIKLSKISELNGSGKQQNQYEEKRDKLVYISFFDICNLLNELIEQLDLSNIVCLIDEWSEIPVNIQFYLADLLKKGFITGNYTLKIAAIPNRTRLGVDTEDGFKGLEDGGDVFGFELDNRYIFEINNQQTRAFFNELLFKHLSAIDNTLINTLVKDYKALPQNRIPNDFINKFLANVALREILIASAGVPRDFINIFIKSYQNFTLTNSSTNRRIGVRNVRIATIDWYSTDKKKQVDNNSMSKKLLEKIVEEIVLKKKISHFLIPEKYGYNPHLQKLIDLRVIHLRKKGYSHKGNAGVSYNVYSIDYGCYNSFNVSEGMLDSSILSNIDTIDDFRKIRRVSLEEDFFNKFLLEIGDSFICPFCKKAIDTTHAMYIKQKICTNCYEKVD